MSPERRDTIERLFSEARALPEEERLSFLEEHCDDEALRQEVISLLGSSEEVADYFDRLAAAIPPALDDIGPTGEEPDPSDPDPLTLEGAQIGRYQIESYLGGGGMGVVYGARDSELDRQVALKFLSPFLSTNERAKERFVKEARSAARLNHPNICTIHDFCELEGRAVLVMEYVEGTTLRQRLREDTISLEEALHYAVQIAEALGRAHEAGIIHRDIKPGNIMVTGEGQVKVMDFGIAKLLDGRPITKTRDTLGTVPYMAPEQIQGREFDHRVDIFSLGVVLHEMITGQHPFAAPSEQAIAYRIVNEEPEALREHIPDVPAELARIVNRALAKDPASRYASARALQRDLQSYRQRSQAGESRTPALRKLARRLRTPQIGIPALVGLLVLSIAILWFVDRRATISWAHREAPAEIERLIEDHQFAGAFVMAQQALAYAPNEPSLERLLESSSVPVAIESDPPGARFFYKPFMAPEEPWREVGTTPLENVLLPRQHLRWRAEIDGYEPAEGSFSTLWRTLAIELVPSDRAREGMVWVPQDAIQVGGDNVEVDGFWIDRYEVTNGEYARFVAAGGYENEAFWRPALDDSDLTWAEVRQMFRDRTGRPGPAGWELGGPPEGAEDLPVSGISWYEAAAYCHFMEKELPTFYHWRRATGLDRKIYTDIQTMSNFSGEGPAPPGQYAGISDLGTYDMAGNVKEWVWNATGERRYILGGAWNEPQYMYQDQDARRPIERGETYGVRCAVYEQPVPDELRRPIASAVYDFSGYEPVDDDVFEILQRFYEFEPSPLNLRVEQEEDLLHWRRETVSFDAAYGGERITVHLYIPRGAAPPYQTVLYFPGSNAMAPGSSDVPNDLAMFDFVIRSGRTLVYPVYQHTYERHNPEWGRLVRTRRDVYIQWSHDVGRTLDYLETRTDIDHETIAFLGFSMGASMGPILGAVHDRLGPHIWLGGGLVAGMRDRPPETFPLNFAPRVETPVLKIGGRDDALFGPPETGRLPLFNHLGTPDEHRRFAMLDGGHIPEWTDVIRETLDWLERYQGPVGRGETDH